MNTILKGIVIRNITDKTSYSQTVKYMKEVEQLFSDNFGPYDMNKLVTNTNINNPTTEYLRKLIYLRNKDDLKKTLTSPQWKEFLLALQTKIKEDTKKEYKISSIEAAMMKLFKEYASNWTGFWTIIEIKGNKIKNIDVFDNNDYEKIKKYLARK